MFRKLWKSTLHGFTIKNSKCIEANNTENIKLFFILSNHTNTELGSLLESSKYLQAEPDVGLSVSLQTQTSNAEYNNPLYSSTPLI